MELTFVGCGDAFGSGGRFNTCFHVAAGDTRFLVDCGASSLLAMKRLGIDHNAIDLVLVTHFHADHLGGVPFLLLDAQLVAKRERPLVIAGPPGLEDRLMQVMEAAFPGSSRARRQFELRLVELAPGVPRAIGEVEVLPAVVRHGEPEGSFYAYRITVAGRVIAYTGDTEWTDSLLGIGKAADLLIAEAYFFDKRVPLHLDYKTLAEKLPSMRPKRVVLTHMSDDMLGREEGVAAERAHDGLVLSI